MQILIDADACPVTAIAVRLAEKYHIKCIVFCDTSHQIAESTAETVVVSKGADSVDFALVNRAQQGDIVVTQDYGLAAMCLSKQASPIRQDGLLYTADNIEGLLHSRYTAGKIRRSGGRMKGPKKRTAQEDAKFAQSLEKLILFLKND